MVVSICCVGISFSDHSCPCVSRPVAKVTKSQKVVAKSVEPRGFEPLFVDVNNQFWTIADKLALAVLRSNKRK